MIPTRIPRGERGQVALLVLIILLVLLFGGLGIFVARWLLILVLVIVVVAILTGPRWYRRY